MQENVATLFKQVRFLSSIAAAAGVLLSLIFSELLNNSSMGWQVVVAITALAIGIPHGALDHLVTLPKAAPLKMATFILLYIAIAIVAVIGILQFNTVGFIIVLFMSAIHLGIGDAAFISENDRRTEPQTKLNRWLYIPAAGFSPVFIPLVNSASTDALASVNPALINWHRGLDSQILIAVTGFAVLAVVIMIMDKRKREALDLTLLLLLAHLAPPLIAFAIYFGCWHAMRHTARLTLSLPRSSQDLTQGLPKKAFSHAVIPGLPALVGTFAVAAVMAVRGKDFSDEFFWMALVVVWALTVPHMLVTAKLDRAALT
jgi:Brp/Blh family beta-carotene 15,15'-monooxygenase